MAFRKVTHTYIIEPLAETTEGTKTADYNNDKTFAENRFGTGTDLNTLGYGYVADDNNKKITVTYVQLDWVAPA